MGVVLGESVLRAEIPATAEAPAVRVIDVHTHVFNVRDLPVYGILRSKGVGPVVAGVLARSILHMTPAAEEGEGLKGRNLWKSVDQPEATVLEQSERIILLRFLHEPDALADEDAPPPENKDTGGGRREREWRDDQLSQEGVKSLEMRRAFDGLSDDAVLIVESLRKAGFLIEEEHGEEARGEDKSIRTLRSAREKLAGYLSFFGIMVRRQDEIATYLRERAYPQVDLFLHHLMDMGTAYGDSPSNLFDRQIDGFARLDRRQGGRLIHFSAYDPFRNSDALPYAQRAMAAGAWGIKVYPPSGYRVAANVIPARPPVWKPSALDRWKSRYEQWRDAGELDAVLDEFFTWAAEKKVPLFTHCTPVGFEAEAGYGENSDPYFWRMVLEKHPDLVLCFGHAGGEAFWFSDPRLDSTMPPVSSAQRQRWHYGRQVVDLCLEFKNVYCGLDFLEPVLTPRGRALAGARLSSLIDLPSADGEWRLGDKVMYGTDWHMMQQVPGFEGYLAAWDEVFRSLDPRWRGRFFAGNAVEFLRMRERAQETRFSAVQRQYWSGLIQAIDRQ